MAKAFGGVVALSDVRLRIPPRSLFALVGPAGSGKTTLLRVLATLEPPDGGTARVAGLELRSQAPAIREKVGYMPQAFGAYGLLSVREYLDFYGSGYGVPRDVRARLIDDLLELVDLGSSQREPVDRLPHDMKQRLGVARCLMHNPELLLLDEPLAGTTSPTARELGHIFRELTDLGKTVILTAGGRQAVPATCTHAAVLEGGGVVRQGLFDELELPPEIATLEVRILDAGDLAIARDALERTPGCGPVLVREDHLLIVRFEGAEADLPKLLAALAAENVSVIGFTLGHDGITAAGGPAARGPGISGGPAGGER